MITKRSDSLYATVVVVRSLNSSKNGCGPTFHISLSLENDEGITSAATVLVTNNSYALDRPETFKFTSEIAVGRVFRLKQCAYKD